MRSIHVCHRRNLSNDHNDEDDVNDNGKKAISSDLQITTLHMHSFFWHMNLFAVAARLCDVKVPNFTLKFEEGREYKTTTFFFFP